MRFLCSGNISHQSVQCGVKFTFSMYSGPTKFEMHTIYRSKVRLKNIVSCHGIFDCYSCKSAINFVKRLISSRFVPISMAAMMSVYSMNLR